jgi:hypothetical protein
MRRGEITSAPVTRGFAATTAGGSVQSMADLIS